MGMGGGGDKQTTKVPGYITDYSTDILNSQQAQFGQKYQPYTGQRQADIDPYRQQAWSDIAAQQGQGAPAFQTAQDTMSGYATGGGLGQPIGYDPMTAQQIGDTTSQLMNPYTQNVIDRAQDEYARQAATQQGVIGGQAANVGAYGGDRQAVAEGTMRAQAARGMGDMTAQLQQQGYSQAMQNAMAMLGGNQSQAYQYAGLNEQMRQADQARQMQAAAALPGVATAQQAYGGQDAQLLAAAGQARQAQAQQGLDINYQNFLEKRGYNQQQIDDFARILGSMPGGGGTVVSGAGGGGLMGGLKGAAGGAAMGAAAGSVVPGWGTAVGAGVGAVGGGLMGGL